MPTAAELIFKIQAVGADQLKQVAVTVDAVRQGTQLAGAQLKTFDSTLNALAASGKTYTQALQEMAASEGVLSNSVRSTAESLLLQLKASQGDEAAIRKLAGTTQSLVGANVAAGAAIRDFTGQSNVRAIESLLTKVLGLGSAFQSLFLLTGVAAAGEELYRLWEKYDPLEKATRDLAKANQELDASYSSVTRTIAGYIEAQARATLGAAGAKGVAAYDAGTQRAEAVAQQNYYLDQVKKAHDALNTGREDSILPGVLGAFLTQRDQAAARARIATFQDKADQQGLLVRQFDEQKKTDDTQGKADRDKTAQREATELTKKRQDAERELQQMMQIAQSKELTGYDAIRAKLQGIVDLKSAENSLTAKGLEYIRQTAIAENTKYSETIQEKARKFDYNAAIAAGNSDDKDASRAANVRDREFITALRKTIEDEQKEVDGGLRAIGRGDQSAADQVRQRANLAIYENNKGTGSGAHGGSAAADANYQVRIKAANDVFQIETRHLDLITEEGKREDALADAKKKAADELYAAEREHAEALDALREKDLQKYHALAESVFDALTDRIHGSGFDIRNMLKNAAHNLGSQVFANATQKVFQTGGHALASLSGGSTFGGMLNGTIFDPANKGAGGPQKDVADNTRKTADWLQKIYELNSGQTATDPAGANPSASPMSISGLPGGNPLAAMSAMAVASLPAALGGSAGASSGLSGLLKLISSPGSSAFTSGASSVLTGGALGNILYGDNTASRIGSAAGLAGALGASALTIASGAGQGGVAGGLKIAGGAVGAATTLATNIAPLLNTVLPAAIPIIGSVIAAALPLVSSLFGSSVQQRANQITNELAQNQFLPNTALNTVQNTNGTLLSMDARGMLRTTALGALPTVAEPYITSERLNGSPYRTYQDAPGGVTQGYSGTVAGTGKAPVSNAPISNAPGITIHMNAIDTQSGIDFIMKNHPAVGAALAEHLRTTDGQAAHAIRFITS